MKNYASYKIVDNKGLHHPFKFEWPNKCNSCISNEPCDAQTWTCKAGYKSCTVIEGSVGLDNTTVTKMHHPEGRKYLDLFSC